MSGLQKISRKDEQIHKRLDKLEIAMTILLDELVRNKSISAGESSMLKQMVLNRE